MHLDEALRVHQDVVFPFMTRSDWLSPLICPLGLRLRLRRRDLGQRL